MSIEPTRLDGYGGTQRSENPSVPQYQIPDAPETKSCKENYNLFAKLVAQLLSDVLKLKKPGSGITQKDLIEKVENIRKYGGYLTQRCDAEIKETRFNEFNERLMQAENDIKGISEKSNTVNDVEKIVSGILQAISKLGPPAPIRNFLYNFYKQL